MSDLPEFFILYNTSRKSSDPYGGLAYVSATKNADNSFSLSRLAHQANDFHIMRNPDGKNGQYSYYGKISITTSSGPVSKPVRDWTNWFAITMGISTTLIPVLEMTSPNRHFDAMVKRNMTFILMPQINNAPNLINPPDPNVIQPIIVKKKHASIPTLNPYVAKQLLTLARQTKDMCPITAEEFMEGHTAAMPCGHMFMQMAIEESFKVRVNECPLCRLPGVPIFL